MTSRTLQVSAPNSAFQVLSSLTTNRAKRHRSRTFLLEGVRPITLALANAWTFDAVIYEADARLSEWAAGVVAGAAAPIRYEMTRDLLAQLSGRDDASELLALVRMRDDDLERIPIRPDALVAVMDRPSNPGNLGTLIRSCDALGADGLIVTGHGVDIYDPATLTASRGSLFALPVVAVPSHTAVVEWIAGARAALGRCQLVGADEGAATPIDRCDLRGPTVLAFGNETHGLSRAYREACDVLAHIPMRGAASSLNVSVAASIVLYEAARQRRR